MVRAHPTVPVFSSAEPLIRKSLAAPELPCSYHALGRFAVAQPKSVTGLVGTACRDAAQEHREAKKRRSDKFEELVAAVYEFDHWVEGVRQRETVGVDIPETV